MIRRSNPSSRADLAAFLRARRARLSPRQAASAGLTGQRRTPGLRRQEVAQLAGLSVDYYIRLEQARGPHPSRQVLSALGLGLLQRRARTSATTCSDMARPGAGSVGTRPSAGDQRRASKHAARQPARHPGLRRSTRAHNVLAWNRLATLFIGDLSGYEDRNMIRWTFLRAAPDTVRGDEALRALHQVHGRRPAGRPTARYPG